MSDLYSRNLLINPSAENGLDGWYTDDVYIEEGGIDGNYCFKIDENGYMKQDIAVPSNSPDIKISAYFLPEQEIKQNNKAVALIRIITKYGDGSKDEYVIPLNIANFG